MFLLKNSIELLYRVTRNNFQVQSLKSKFTDARMRKDYNKRQCLKMYGKEKLRLNGLRKNKILPKDLQEIADQEIAALPRDSSISRVVDRCVITSRPRGVISQFRVSRIIFRHLADYNKLAGTQRACW